MLDWLAKPENLQQTDSLPPFVENFDIGAYVLASLPIASFVLGVNVLDEVAQRAVALQRKVCTFIRPACYYFIFWQLSIMRIVRYNVHLHRRTVSCCEGS